MTRTELPLYVLAVSKVGNLPTSCGAIARSKGEQSEQGDDHHEGDAKPDGQTNLQATFPALRPLLLLQLLLPLP